VAYSVEKERASTYGAVMRNGDELGDENVDGTLISRDFRVAGGLRPARRGRAPE
jgi:hypothetical protein